MNLLLMRHLWGVDAPWQAVFPKIKAAGYAGIEWIVPDPDQRAAFRDLLAEHRFAYIAQIWTDGPTVADHLALFRAQLTAAAEMKPLFINSHTGRDAWSEADSRHFFAEALKMEADFGLPVAHETHRGRVLYNPWVVARLMDAFPALQLCCDFSHWVCISERLIDDQEPILRQAADRAIHIHARVGHEQGPQVPDPRAPEYQRHVEAHERWWGWVWEAQRRRGLAQSTLTPEYGPPPYLATLPYTQMPVTDLWEICNWQAQREAARFAELMV